MRGLVILSHGQESGPDATKVTTLALVAERLGWASERPDYRGIASPLARRDHLLSRIRASGSPVVLVGSSMGAYVSGLAALEAPVAGMFLLAPPISLGAEWPPFDAAAVPCAIVHGWRDELIPAVSVIDFASARGTTLHLVDDEHRLSHHVDACAAWFRQFLDAIR
ncbi:MAG TPA: hypothetical protein VND91_00940 [Candidatus Saccharimonadia bacterium]|nr:hypothetical protein [Candidatus Saccharimonadia bacterium]